MKEYIDKQQLIIKIRLHELSKDNDGIIGTCGDEYITLIEDFPTSDKVERALEKQIAKKPSFIDVRFRHHGKHISDGSSLDKCYKCPNCNSHIFHTFDSDKYCIHCGQRLDWSGMN